MRTVLRVLILVALLIGRPSTSSSQDPELDHFYFLPVVNVAACAAPPCLIYPPSGTTIDTLLPEFTFDLGANEVSYVLVFGQCRPIGSSPQTTTPPMYPGRGKGRLAVRVGLAGVPGNRGFWCIQAGDPVNQTHQNAFQWPASVPPGPPAPGPVQAITSTNTLTLTWPIVPEAIGYSVCLDAGYTNYCDWRGHAVYTMTLPLPQNVGNMLTVQSGNYYNLGPRTYFDIGPYR